MARCAASMLALAALVPLAAGLAVTSAPPTPPSNILGTMTSSRCSPADKIRVLSDLQALRSVDGAFEEKLDELVAEVEATRTNPLATRRWPLVARLPSRRIRNGAVRRLLDTTLRSDNSAKQGDDARYKRSALLVILRQLAEEETSGVRALERDVMKTRGKQPSMEDMLSFTPDLETPKYEVVEAVSGSSNGLKLAWEVRDYAEPFSVVTSEMAGGAAGGASSFQSLAGYIFGKNKEETKMAMVSTAYCSEARGCPCWSRSSHVCCRVPSLRRHGPAGRHRQATHNPPRRRRIAHVLTTVPRCAGCTLGTTTRPRRSSRRRRPQARR